MALLPFDETGKLASNLKRETHTVNSVNVNFHNFILPDWAPFFKTGFTVFHVESGRYLDEGVDFFFSHYFELADDKLADKVYSSITFFDKNITGTFQLSMQSLGGDFVDSSTQALTSGLDTLANLSSVRWEDIVTPPTFPPTSHEHVVTGVEGVNRHLEEMTKIREALAKMWDELTLSDITDFDAEFRAPLMSSLSALTAAIIADSRPRELPHYYSLLFTDDTSGTNDVDLGVVTQGTWVQLPLTMLVVQPGEYKLTHNVGAEIEAPADIKVLYRWTFNGVPVGRSMANGTVHTVNANTQIRLEAKVVGADTTKFLLASAEHASGIEAVFLAN